MEFCASALHSKALEISYEINDNRAYMTLVKTNAKTI